MRTTAREKTVVKKFPQARPVADKPDSSKSTARSKLAKTHVMRRGKSRAPGDRMPAEYDIRTDAMLAEIKSEVRDLLQSIRADLSDMIVEGEVQKKESAGDATQRLGRELLRRGPDNLLEKLRRRGIESVLQGTVWRTAREVSDWRKPNAANPNAIAHQLVKSGRLFGIKHGGDTVYPDYAFETPGVPWVAMKSILEALSGYTDFQIASWFESTSAYLGGARPRELINKDPGLLLEAARMTRNGSVHG